MWLWSADVIVHRQLHDRWRGKKARIGPWRSVNHPNPALRFYCNILSQSNEAEQDVELVWDHCALGIVICVPDICFVRQCTSVWARLWSDFCGLTPVRHYERLKVSNISDDYRMCSLHDLLTCCKSYNEKQGAASSGGEVDQRSSDWNKYWHISSRWQEHTEWEVHRISELC